MSHRLPIPAAVLAQHIAIIGKTGAGKTSTGKLIAEHVVAEGARVCILDPIKSDWWGLISSADGKRAGLPFQILGGPHGHVPLHAGAGKAIGELVANGSLPLSIIDMAEFKAGGAQKFFVDFAPALMKHRRGVLYLFLEEAHEFAPKERAGFGDENMSVYYAKKLATAGRSLGLRMIVMTHSVQQLHNRVLDACDTLIAQRLTTPASQKPILDWLKANVSDKEKQKEIAESLSSLKTGTGWLCAGESGKFERIAFPRISTYDNSATPTSDSRGREVKTAPVDVDKLRAIVGDAVKEAEASDPKLLKRQIADLQRQVAAKPVAAAPATKSKDDAQALKQATATIARLESALEEAMKFILQINATDFIGKAGADVDKVALEKAIAAAVAQAMKLVEGAQQSRNREITDLKKLAAKVAERLDRIRKDTSIRIAVDVRHNEPFTVAPAARAAEPRRAPPSAPRKAGDSELSAPRQKILDKLAWLESHGIYPAPKETLAAVAGVSPTSGGYFNNLGALKSAGLITYPQPGTVAFTDDGRAIAAVPNDPRPVHEHWLEVVERPQAKILEALIERHPDEISKDDLAGVIGVSASSGGYFNNLGRLRTLGAIDYPRPGYVALTQHVMP